MLSEIRQVAANGVRLGYQVYGESSGRPPALFVHGYSGRSTEPSAYPALLHELTASFTVYALDLRGHGESASQVDGWSLTACADDVAAVARNLGIEGALYIGHSMGAFTGMFCEVRHPGTFSALCLINTASAEGGGYSPPEAGQLLIQHGRELDVLREALLPMYVRGGDPTPHAAAAVLMDRRVHEAFYAEYNDRIIIDQIRTISIPVLAINGALDNVVPLSTQHTTALALQKCKEVVFMTEGHLLPVEAPSSVAREIIAFWEHDLSRLFSTARPIYDRYDPGTELKPVTLPTLDESVV